MILLKQCLLASLVLVGLANSSWSSSPTNAPTRAKTDTNVLTSFGFTGPEIFPIDSQISQLRVADLDGDGLNDLIVVNNSRSKIDLLYNQTGKTNLTQKPMPGAKREMNELPPDSR